MFARLALLGIVSIAACVSQRAWADAFDDQALRESAAALAKDWGTLFSFEELGTLRAAIATASGPQIEDTLASKVQIEVSINPEARVTARRTAVPIPTAPCGAFSAWLIRVANTGYVTTPLVVHTAKIPGSRAFDVRVAKNRLTGGQVEYRVMEVRVEIPGPIEVTLLFTAGVGTNQLGPRAQVPVLVTCS
jgi:hypothetical protein